VCRRYVIYAGQSTTPGGSASIRAVTLRRDQLTNSYQLTPRHSSDGLLNIELHASTDFLFRFISAFEYSNFIYFVTTQREYPERPYSSLITRLVRLCPRDVNFQSYTEVTLECRQMAGSWNIGPATAAQLAFKVCFVSDIFVRRM